MPLACARRIAAAASQAPAPRTQNPGRVLRARALPLCPRSAIAFVLLDAAGSVVVAFQPGQTYTLLARRGACELGAFRVLILIGVRAAAALRQVTPSAPSRGLLTVSAGALEDARLWCAPPLLLLLRRSRHDPFAPRSALPTLLRVPGGSHPCERGCCIRDPFAPLPPLRSAGRRQNFMAVASEQRTLWTAPASGAATDVAVTFSQGLEYRTARITLAASPTAASPSRSMSGMAGMDMGTSSAEGSSYVAEMHVGTLHVDTLHAHAHMGGGGSWAGHSIPAAFFLIWGTFWAASAIAGVAAAGAARVPFRVRAWYPFFPATLPRSYRRLRALEPILKVALPSFGAFCELYFHPAFRGHGTGSQFNSMWLKDGSGFDEGHAKFWQHASMYGFFILSGCVDLRAAKLLPPGASHAVLTGAFLGEAFLFYFHLQSQTGMLQLIHLLLVYSIMGCAAATAVEAVTGSGLAALARGACGMMPVLVRMCVVSVR